MPKLCVFAGTTEGREIAEFLAAQDADVTVCVATEYGETLLPQGENLHISARPLPREEMKELFRREGYDLVIDATHPYAKRITESVAGNCAATNTEYLRLLRPDTALPENAVFVEDAAAAAEYLDRVDGNILLTTGSRELRAFAALRNFSERVYARVLPMEDSLRLCREAGVQPSHILAMQGPFSKELNAAMLRSTGAAYMVTKASGSAGGLEEKLAAAAETGAVPVILGRPAQREGLNTAETIALLCRRFGFHARPNVAVVGLGPGSRAALTGEAREAISRAGCLIGAARMLEAAAAPGQATHAAIAPEDIRDYILAHPEYGSFAVVMSGDTGFFSGTRKLLPRLTGCRVTVLPGLSSLSYLCAKLGTSYEDVLPVTLHGRSEPVLLPLAQGRRCFVLVGGENGMGKLCRTLTDNGMGAARVSVGERLSYPDEAITTGTAEELSEKHFEGLAVALIEYSGEALPITAGLPDEAFSRAETVPMTKSEIRAVCLSKLAPREDSVIWDVGAGTGSVTIEAAFAARRGRVYAVEQKDAACDILRENLCRFHTDNVELVSGTAPEACAGLPAPTHAFLGGTSGHMKEIIALLREKNPHVRIVATAVTLESVAELTECVKAFPFRETEAVSITAARSRKAGAYHLMTGQNPVYIFTMQG